jgi:hypothetical protein
MQRVDICASPRNDAVAHRGRYIVPLDGQKAVTNWQEFRAAGGVAHFNEDQTIVALSLPEGFVFSIQFMRPIDDGPSDAKLRQRERSQGL